MAGFGHFNGDYHARRAFKMTLPPVLARPGRQSPISLRVDGVVDLGNGTFQAIFGYTNTSATAAQPASNVLYRNGRAVPSPVPPLPTQFAPGGHPGTYVPTFNGNDTISWAVDGQAVVASGHTTRLDRLPDGEGGYGVMIDGQLVPISADLEAYSRPPSQPVTQGEPQPGTLFKGTLPGTLSVGPSGGAAYTVRS